MFASAHGKFFRLDLVVKTVVGSSGLRAESRARSTARVKHSPYVLIFSILLLWAGAERASAIEHPGTLPKDADCFSCHADKTRGASVHSAMATLCTVCHLTRTQGDMTTVNLFMPKEQICFACHEQATEARQHPPTAKGRCVDCHDAHSSDQRMLLRAVNQDSRTITKR